MRSHSRLASIVCASHFYPKPFSVQYAISGQRAILLDQGPFNLRYALSSRARSFSLCFFFSLGCSCPRLRPIQSAPWALIPDLSIWSTRCDLILIWYPFNLHFALSSGVRSFNMHLKNQYTLILRYYPFSLRFMLSSWNLFSLFIAFSSLDDTRWLCPEINNISIINFYFKQNQGGRL